MALLILFGLFAIGVSFLCSLLEACLLSLPRSYVASLVDRGAPFAELLREMKDQIDRPLAAILTLNTIAHTAGAAGVGAQAAVVFGSGAVGVASAVMTLLVLVFSEIIPKTLGAMHARALALPAAVTIRGMIWLCLPIIVPLEWINRLVGAGSREETLSRAELIATMQLGHRSGALRQREFELASNLITLREVKLESVMTPRTVVFRLPEQTTAKQFASHEPLRFSRIPVFDQSDPERITGYVPRFAVQASLIAGRGDNPIGSLKREMPVLPEGGSVGVALDTLIRMKCHIAQVVDEYGGFAGIVTLEDLLETLLGEEIVDESDRVADMRTLASKPRRPARG